MLLVGLATLFMGYQATKISMSYDFPEIVPPEDEDRKVFEQFQQDFDADADLIAVGIKTPLINQKDFFNDWYALGRSFDSLPNIESVFSLGEAIYLQKDTVNRRFDPQKIFETPFEKQEDLYDAFHHFQSLPFYEGLIYNKENHATFIAITFEKDLLASEKRKEVIAQIEESTNELAEKYDIRVYYSGLPFVRTVITRKVSDELLYFSILSLAITAFMLLLIFRNFYVVIFPLVVICVIIISTLGTIYLLGYQITILTSLIPPLIAIIGVPNFIYFVNKFHAEYKKHGNKARAITRMVERIGVVTFLTNLTTAIGFGVLAFTDSPILREFGTVASINVFLTFVVSLILIPAVFSMLPPPTTKQTNHLDSKLVVRVVGILNNLVIYQRKYVYLATFAIVVFAVMGLMRLTAVGYILDDIPQDDKLRKDLEFFEENFNGIMPFEVVVKAPKPKMIFRTPVLSKVVELEEAIAEKGVFSKSVSMADFYKFATQSFYGGNEDQYRLPAKRELSFLRPYVQNMTLDSASAGPFVTKMYDDSETSMRINIKIKDIGSEALKEVVKELEKDVLTIFGEASGFEVVFTGVSPIFLKNNAYLIDSLINSLILAFILVSIIMGLLFAKIRIVFISLLPNFLPLLVTAGIMGWLGITLKPSTVLVFSIAFGISVDDALHFLIKYRQESKLHTWNKVRIVSVTLAETGLSMIYTSVVLFCGFIMFYPSSFGGTSALGLLTSLTLLVAMITNTVLLPSLLLTFDKDQKAKPQKAV